MTELFVLQLLKRKKRPNCTPTFIDIQFARRSITTKKHATSPKKTKQTNKRPSIPLKLYLG